MNELNKIWTTENALTILNHQNPVQADTACSYAVLENILYCAYVSSNKILLLSSVDGTHWSAIPETLNHIHTNYKPAIAYLGTNLYCAWIDNRNKSIKYAVFDGKTWQLSQNDLPLPSDCYPEQPPALLSAQGKLYCAVLQPGSAQHIHLLWTQDGKKWSAPQQAVLSGIGTKFSPSLAWYNNSVYCVWNGWHNDGVFFSTFDGQSWQHQKPLCQLNGKHAPVLAVQNNTLYLGQSDNNGSISVVSIDTNNKITTLPLITTSCAVTSLSLIAFNQHIFCSWLNSNNVVTYVSDFVSELNFSNTKSIAISGKFNESNGPALAVGNGQLFLAWLEPSNSQYIRFKTTTDGESWTDGQALGGDNPPTGIGTRCAPALTFFNGSLYCAWNGYHNDGIFFSHLNGKRWADQQRIINNDSAEFSKTDCAPALAVHQNRLYVAWKDKSSNHIYAANMDVSGKWTVSLPLKVNATHQPAIASYNNLLYCVWRDKNDGNLYASFLAEKIWSTAISVAGLTSFGSANIEVKDCPVALFSVYNKLYLTYQVLINRVPNMAMASTFNGESWHSEAFFQLSPKQGNTSNTGKPAITAFGQKLFVAWNDYQQEGIAYASASIAKQFQTSIFETDGRQSISIESFDSSKKNLPNVGVCLSGGGSRAATAALGQLRGLKHLTIDGTTSLLEQTRALSTVSGGSWLGGAFTYLNLPEISDDDFLNRYVENRNQLVLEANGEATDNRYILSLLPPGNFGTSLCSESMYFPKIAAAMFRLYSENNVPVNKIWQTVVGQNILKPFGLYQSGHFGPDSLYSYNQETLTQNVTGPNPQLDNVETHLYPPVKKDPERINRPFWICNLSMLTNNANPSDSFRYFLPIQATPFFSGTLGSPEGVLDNSGLPIQPGSISPFSYGSRPISLNSNQQVAQIDQSRQMSLADIIGISSSFFVAIMKGTNRKFFTEQEINAVVQQAEQEPHRLLGSQASSSESHDVATMIEMVMDMLKELGLWSRLMEVQGLNNQKVQDLVTYLCKGIIQFVSMFDIDPDLKNVFYIFAGASFAIASLVHMIITKHNPLPSFGDLLYMLLSDVIPKACELLPKYYFWPTNASALNADIQMNEFGDPGLFENTGLANLMAYDDIDRAICFVNSTGIIEEEPVTLTSDNPNVVQTNIRLNDEIPLLFGYQPWSKNVGGYALYTPETQMHKEFKNNQIFESSQFANLIEAFKTQLGKQCREHAANVLQENLVTVENRWFGVKAGKNVKVLWSILNYAQEWVDGLNDQVKQKVVEIGDFPNYSIQYTQLTQVQLNLMSHFTAWTVAGDENAALFKKLYSL